MMIRTFPAWRTGTTALLFGLAPLIGGCGGGGLSDMGGFNRQLGGDLGNGYNTSLNSRYGNQNGQNSPNSAVGRGVYPMVEASFALPDFKGDPFDFEKSLVTVTVRKPDNTTIDVPAFYDGDTTWRVRYTPTAPGQHSIVGVKLNREAAHEQKLEPTTWDVKGDPKPGFVRVDRGDKTRFVFDNGARYFPLGHNVAWQNGGDPDIPAVFAKMGEAGENWSRVWMNHWDGKNLDWPAKGKPEKLGVIDLEAARRWDSIVQAADKNGIYFQLVLQHHGQYSSSVNPNWNDSPYNEKNGGFLKSPEDFFTDPKARALTRRKLFYAAARWGYSPSIMAWELFNEVQFTDAAKSKRWEDVAMWHREMALFLRQADPYGHLVTTSSAPAVSLADPVQSRIWDTVDYVQTHTYPSDLIVALGGPESGKKIDKPHFVGEYGPSNLQDEQGISLHAGLWASLSRSPSGAAQYWDWTAVEKHNLYSEFKSVSAFLAASGLPSQGGLTSVTFPVESTQRAALRFGPGGDWGKAETLEFVVGQAGPPSGMESLPPYLQGDSNRALMPKPLTFQVNYSQPGSFAVRVAQVSKGGGKLVIKVDGKAVEREYSGGEREATPKPDQAVLSVEVSAGAHTVTVENTGADWIKVREFALSNYAPALASFGRVGKDYAFVWLYHRAYIDMPGKIDVSPATGKLTLTGLRAGKYRVTWWDTSAGKSLDSAEVTVGKEAAVIETPPVIRDIALYVGKSGTPEKTAKIKSEPSAKPASRAEVRK